MKEMDRIVLACGQRRVYILEVVPCFFLKPCCDDPTHCANVCQHDHTAVDAGKQFLRDLSDLNSKMAARLCSATLQFVSTGDILSGITNCSMGELTDALFNCWRNDPIHGDKIAYTRIAVGPGGQGPHQNNTGRRSSQLHPDQEEAAGGDTAT